MYFCHLGVVKVSVVEVSAVEVSADSRNTFASQTMEPPKTQRASFVWRIVTYAGGMTYAFSVDPSAPEPLFRQVHNAVIAGIASGDVKPGQRLPTTRALAAELGLAVNTIASAYRSLESAGVIEGRGRAGTFVSLGPDPVATAAREIALEAAARLRDLGLDAEAARRMLDEAVDTAQ